VGVGLILMPASWLYAQQESGRACKAWKSKVDASGPIGPMTAMLMHGPMPDWVDVSPLPGVLTGGGATVFGVLLLAIRRPGGERLMIPRGQEAVACQR
jgi:hypothetical protein